jgi:type IV fimbrial biogenesis protein FimT
MGTLKQRGFTLIELLVAIAIAAILLAVAVPSFQAAVNSNRLAGASNEMLASLQTARMEAVRRNRRTIVCFSANPSASSPACGGVATGWITFVDDSSPHNQQFDAGTDTLLRSSTFSAPVEVSGLGTVSYRSDGLAHDTATGILVDGSLDICIQTEQPAENVRHVNIGSGSRVSVSSEDKDGSCG